MKKRLVPILLLVTMVIGLNSLSFAFASEKPVVIAQVKGALEPDIALETIMSNISYVDWVFLSGDLTADDLADATMLISVLSDMTQGYSETEVTAIKDWLDEGGKTLWLCADSDYGSDYLRINTQNALLEEIGSVLRCDHCAVEDPISNGGAPYRVLSVTDNIATEFEFLAVGVDRVLTHSPGVLTAYSGDRYWKLSEEQPDNVYLILTTSESGQLYDHNAPEPESVAAGDEGTFVTLAMEVDWEKGNTVILESEAPFGSYMPMYYPEMIRDDRYGAAANPQQGGPFFENLISYATVYSGRMFEYNNQVTSLTEDIDALNTEVMGLEADLASARSSASTMQMYAIGALVLGLVIGVFVGPMIRK